MKTIRILLSAISLLLPASAYADYSVVDQTVGSVGSWGGLPFMMAVPSICTGSIACGFVQIAETAVYQFRPALTIAAVLMIVLYGYKMIVGQEDDMITKARGVMSGTIAGLIMMYLIDPFIYAFYGTSGDVPASNIAGGAARLSLELIGLINWTMTIVAALAIIMLILSALKSMGNSTGEEGIGNMRKTIFSVIFGLVLLGLRFVLSYGFAGGTYVSTGMTYTDVGSWQNPGPMLAMLLAPVSFAMGFLALAGIVVVIYAGLLCVFNMGNEENFGKAKALLTRAAIGTIVVLMSLALVRFVIL